MKILILGGTGAMGKHLVNLLDRDGVETVVTSRKKRNSQGHIRYIQGDARDRRFLENLLQEQYDCIVDFMIYTTQEFLYRYKKLLSNTKQYVFLSSSRVYANSDSPITEDSPRLLDISTDAAFLATDEYALAKARQEDILRNSGTTNWTIIRPYITYSEIRLQLGVLEKEEWLYRALHGRTIVFSENIAKKTTTLTHGYDVARGLYTLIGNEFAYSRIFQITGNQSVSWNDVLNIYVGVLKKELGYTPKVLLCSMTDFMKCHFAEYQIKYDRMFDRVFDNSRIKQFIDVESFKNTEKGLSDCLTEFLKDTPFFYLNGRTEAYKDRLTHEYTPLKEIRSIKQKIKYILFRFLLK
ncbi:NAD-dependent epimerase/dehydratase family protein [Treponema brennaborense]|uniref:NAD-dependent epimerase/dehydratase n=1 Tax=Treponema brennaborense (strain DSM 12168 / CIP 105900 / DD5/3) TaxID=906968 RepID=F4LNN4_TREBD|nr:NAD-dependent epimerase/dehydratase family protein [Treponema brennaborense]AEE15888.1 NAD-dependent epimerase/dehydratase [Treponema brennaborense DSM 12168]